MTRKPKPPAVQTFSLAKQKEGEDSRFVSLSVTASQVRVSTSDAGPRVLQFWQSGESEYEFWVDVASEAMPALLFALLKEKYEGKLDAVNEFRSFCEKNDVPHNSMQWFTR